MTALKHAVVACRYSGSNLPGMSPEEFRKQGGIRQINAGPEARASQIEELTQTLAELLRNPQACEALGRNAFSILEKNRGATQVTADQISSVFQKTQPIGEGLAAGYKSEPVPIS